MLQLDQWQGTRLPELPPAPPRPAAPPAPPDRRRRLGWRGLLSAAAMLVVVAGLAFMWPRSFGGAVSYVKVSGTSMLPTFRSGELAVVRSAASYRVGDVIAYRIPRGQFGAGNVVIHRIVGGSARVGYVTRGDNRRAVDQWRPRAADVLGRQWAAVPRAGEWFGWFRAPLRLGLLCGGITFLLLMWGGVAAGTGPHAGRKAPVPGHPR